VIGGLPERGRPDPSRAPPAPWEVLTLGLLEPSHLVYALRPADPLQVTWGFYSPDASFATPTERPRWHPAVSAP
jgi:hypothetical protein